MKNRPASIADALDLLVPPFESPVGDWEAILGAAAPPARPRRRRMVFLAATAVLVVVLLAEPAFGVQGLVLDLIGRHDVTFSKSPPAPNEIKKRFEDLGIGAPPRYATHVLAARARDAGSLEFGGKAHELWIAPTSTGGYCFDLEGAWGGCRAIQEKVKPLEAGWNFVWRRGQTPRVLGAGGTVSSPAVARLELDYTDGTHIGVPFIWVSKPIETGFFGFRIAAGETPKALVAYSRDGTVIGRSAPAPIGARLTLPSHSSAPRTPRRLAPGLKFHPKAPLQKSSAAGISVIAGANGAVTFTATDVPPSVARMLRRSVTYSCFRLTREFGIFTVRGYGTEGAFARSVGFRLFGVGTPLDGCELTSERGHRWPDTFGSHAPVELAFTAKGRAYFADRAAARDLALFVRAGRMQDIRKEQGRRLLRDAHAAYPQLATSRIELKLTANGVTFSEASATGKRFEVVVAAGRISKSNVAPYAKVF
ncbi:MAG TPA: hypothetical protein VGM80_18380 [Gaiellaceae bacterium]